METNAIAIVKIPEGSMRQRREAMEAMVDAGNAMIKAYEEHGYLPLPEKYSLVARQVQEFIECRMKSLGFKYEPRTLEELV